MNHHDEYDSLPERQPVSWRFAKVGNNEDPSRGYLDCNPSLRKGKRMPKRYKKTLRDKRRGTEQ